MDRVQLASPITVGLVGAGGIAMEHVLALQTIPNVKIVAVCDVDERRAQSLARRFEIPKAYGSLAAMLNDSRLDVVHVLTPPSTHVSLALEAIAGGCDVFVEKPLGMNSADCRRLCEEASRLKRVVGVNHSDAHAPAFRGLLDVIASQRLGRVNHVAVTYAAPVGSIPIRSPGHYMFSSLGNEVFEFGPHPFSMVRLVMGRVLEVSTIVAGEVKVRKNRSVFQSWICSIVCERGTAQVAISLGEGLKEITTHIIGEDGMAFADSRRGFLLVYESTPYRLTENVRFAVSNSWKTFIQTSGALFKELAVKLRLVPYATPNGFSQSIRAFYNARANGQAIAEDAVAGFEVIRFCEEAIASQRVKADGAGTWLRQIS